MERGALGRELVGAVLRNDGATVERLLAQGAEINEKDEHGWTALTHALQRRRLGMARLLRSRGARPGLVDWVWLGQPEEVRRALEEVAGEPSGTDWSGLIGHAAGRGASEVLRHLLREVARRGERPDLGWAVHAAASGGHTEAVRILLDAAPDGLGESIDCAVVAAAGWGHESTFWWLLASHPVETRTLGAALILAARENHVECVRLALDGGGAVDHRLEDGSTALLAAARNGHVPALSCLIDHGAAIDARPATGETALMIAAREGHLLAVRCLLASGADPNARNNEGRDALSLVCLRWGADGLLWLDGPSLPPEAVRAESSASLRPIAEALVTAGASPAEAHRIAIAIAARVGDAARIARCLDLGGDGNLVVAGLTPLIEAARGGHTGAVAELLRRGAEADRQGPDGQTALMLAAAEGHGEVVRLLLDRGASVNLADRNGETALDVAEVRERNAIADLLRRHGARRGDEKV